MTRTAAGSRSRLPAAVVGLVLAPVLLAACDRSAAAPRSALPTASPIDGLLTGPVVGPAVPSAAADGPVEVAVPTSSPSAAAPAPRPVLPRGGRQVFPDHVVVMHYGTAGTGVLGVLGEGTPQQAAERLGRAATPYAKAAGRRVLPAMELITTVARRAPGRDGLYSTGISDEQVQRYLDAARRNKMLLVLDFQPGKADLLSQVRRYERFLKEPEVGVALDPEWKLTGSQRPGRQIGRVGAAEINRVSAYLATLRRDHDLPEKLFVLHQFRSSMLPDRDKIALRNGLATVLHVDGFGGQGIKRKAYSVLQDSTRFHMGFKLFYDEDTDLMTPAEAMALRPRPELISYQ